ncbi:hypothetical protein SXCC_02885 [Gluconacetobacter sp. SXCC-1]|nr:hypothetical protein SXCC_02885 [Gluconacetobacter sp. SXCC-1]
MIPGLITGESIGGDICLLNTVQKNHTHAQQLKDIIFGPEDFVA